MNFDQLECFIKTYENMSFAKAANELYLAPSSLTYQITSLEEELECQLFIRTKKGLQASEEGKQFYEDALHLLTYYQKSRVTLYELKNRTKNQISIGFDRVPDTFFILDFFEEYKQTNDIVVLYDVTNMVNSVMEFLMSEYSFAFMYLDEVPNKSEVGFIELDIATYYGVMAKANPLANKKTLKMSDLSNQTICILKDYQHTKFQYPSIYNLHKIGSKVRPYNDFSALLFGMQANQGMGIYPATHTAISDKLVRIPFEDLPALHFGIVFKKMEASAAILELLKDIQNYYIKQKHGMD